MSTSTDTVILKGQLKWAVVPPTRTPLKLLDPKPGQENNTNWSIEVECDRDKYEELLENGMSPMTMLRKNEDGTRSIKLKCPKVNGTYIAKDPDIVDSNGKAIEVPIANGSTGEVYAVFERFKSKQTGKEVTTLRFKKVVVTNLIPYVRSEDANPFEQEEAHSQDLNSSKDW